MSLSTLDNPYWGANRFDRAEYFGWEQAEVARRPLKKPCTMISADNIALDRVMDGAVVTPNFAPVALAA